MGSRLPSCGWRQRGWYSRHQQNPRGRCCPSPPTCALPVGCGEDCGWRLVAVRGADRQQVQPTVDRFMQLVADTRGLQLHSATSAHAAITFDVDPHASVVGTLVIASW